MLPSSLIHCIAVEVPPLFHSSLWMSIASFSPAWGHCSSCRHMQGLTVHRRSSLDGASCYSPSNSPLTFLCPDFWGKLAMGEGRMLLISQKLLSLCFLKHPQVLSCTCPSRHGGQCSSGGVFILSIGPTTIPTNNNNIFNGLPGLKAVCIPRRSVFNSLSQAEGLSLQRCLEQKCC